MATFTTQTILVAVKDFVRHTMQYDTAKTDALSHAYESDQIIALSQYLQAGIGVCRHQALLAGLFIESLAKDGFLAGKAGVERNTVVKLGGAHAWAIFKGTSEPQVVDAAQNFVGTKANARQQNRWYYELSSDEPGIITPEAPKDSFLQKIREARKEIAASRPKQLLEELRDENRRRNKG